MNMTSVDMTAPARFYVDDTISITPPELEAAYVARFRDLADTPETFADASTPTGKRKHFHVISVSAVHSLCPAIGQ
jgi:hypothetical protein